MIDHLQHERETGQVKKNKKIKNKGVVRLVTHRVQEREKEQKEQGGRGQSNIVTH